MTGSQAVRGNAGKAGTVMALLDLQTMKISWDRHGTEQASDLSIALCDRPISTLSVVLC
ncbi:SapB/AmfS family lanthipeptide [Streptomyces sp. enrichment culture]|uniref:SapB/AmfS family lanthipeptide n=1 Tax=Streptomyces sp. enrichment culture TaxID=1795815 RepID=UPI003F561629